MCVVKAGRSVQVFPNSYPYTKAFPITACGAAFRSFGLRRQRFHQFQHVSEMVTPVDKIKSLCAW